MSDKYRLKLPPELKAALAEALGNYPSDLAALARVNHAFHLEAERVLWREIRISIHHSLVKATHCINALERRPEKANRVQSLCYYEKPLDPLESYRNLEITLKRRYLRSRFLRILPKLLDMKHLLIHAVLLPEDREVLLEALNGSEFELESLRFNEELNLIHFASTRPSIQYIMIDAKNMDIRLSSQKLNAIHQLQRSRQGTMHVCIRNLCLSMRTLEIFTENPPFQSFHRDGTSAWNVECIARNLSRFSSRPKITDFAIFLPSLANGDLLRHVLGSLAGAFPRTRNLSLMVSDIIAIPNFSPDFPTMLESFPRLRSLAILPQTHDIIVNTVYPYQLFMPMLAKTWAHNSTNLVTIIFPFFETCTRHSSIDEGVVWELTGRH